MFVTVIQIVGLVTGPVFAFWVLGVLVERWRFRHFSTRARRVEARIQGIRTKTIGGDGESQDYHVIVWRWQHPETHELHFFKSGYLAEDPTPYIDRYKVVHVLVDPDHPDRYRLDEPGLEQLKAKLLDEYCKNERLEKERRRRPPTEEELDDMMKQIFEIKGAGKAYERYRREKSR